jgi:hypothetical protein
VSLRRPAVSSVRVHSFTSSVEGRACGDPGAASRRSAIRRERRYAGWVRSSAFRAVGVRDLVSGLGSIPERASSEQR